MTTPQLRITRWRLAAGLLLALLQPAGAWTNDDLLVYSDRLNNGWGDWGWVQHYATNNPVYAGANSMCLAPTGGWQAWWLAHDPIDTSLYTNVTFWLNGGTIGGQSVGLNAMLNGSGGPRIGITAPTNSWKQFTISLSSLNAANVTNFNGLQFWSNTGSTQPAFFLDAITVVPKPPPATVHLSVNATQAVRTVDAKVFGVNQVAWDGNVYNSTSVGLMNDLGNPCLRWPGGSWGDGYHWTNEYRGWGSYSSDFINLATNTHAQSFIIVNYGSSSPEEAAYGVRMFNVTNHCGFKYWEVGNEVGGAWETDWRQPGFATTDFLNLPSFATKLYTPTNNISTYLRSQLSSSTLTTLGNYMGNHSAYDSALRSALANDINNVINSGSPSSIYKADTNRFAGITFRSVTWTNLSLPIPNIGQDLNNRMELEDAYPTDLAQITPAVNLASNWPDVYLPHDAWTYAMRFTNFYAKMKAADPTILVGAVADITEDGTSSYTNHPVVNPRTGLTHSGWTPVMLTYLRSNNVTPDFLIEHKYPPSDGDTYNLLWSKSWSSDVTGLRQMVTDYLGNSGTNVTLECTENGTTGDAQSVSLVGGLLFADSLGQVLQTELNSRVWWDTRNNGPDGGTVTNPDPALYGWRTNSSGNYYQDGGIVYNAGAPTNRYPKYYAAKLITRFASGGDQVVNAGSDYQLLSAYAVRRTNGLLSMLVINKSAYASLTGSVAVSGYVPLTNATIYSYGIPQDEAARTNGTTQAQDLTTNSFTSAGGSFSYTFPPFSLTVLALSPSAPVITCHPAATNVLAGSNATFRVTAYGASTLGYQWRFNGTNISGATSSSFSVTNAQPTNAGNYSVAVTNAAGTALSSNAPLVVNVPAYITVPITNQTVQLSGNAAFVVTAAGTAPLAYRWYRGAGLLTGQTNSTLALTNVGFAQAAQYSVVVTNLYGMATSGPVNLNVVDTIPPTITTCASNRTLAAGLNCLALLPDLTGQVAATDASGSVTITQAPPSGTALGLGLTNVTLTARDSSGNASYCTAAVTVVDVTPPTVLACVPSVALGAATNCQWSLPNLTTTNYILASDNCSSVTVTQMPASGVALSPGTNWVVLTAFDAAGNFTNRTLAVTVPGLPYISSPPQSLVVGIASNATFSVTACGPGLVQYQWQHAGTNLGGATASALQVSAISPQDEGAYLVIISNTYGSVTSSVASLTVLQPPVITNQPQSQAAVTGGSVTFAVGVSGREPFGYQWRTNGAALPGQTNATLSLLNLQAQSFTDYTVLVTNTDGSVLSDTARVTVAVSPAISSPGFQAGAFILTFPTEPGPTYVIEYKDALDATPWQFAQSYAGTGQPITFTNSALGSRMRYYRVRLQ